MAEMIKAIVLDVARTHGDLELTAKQYDKNTRFLSVTFTSEGKILKANKGSLVYINAKRHDGSANAFLGTVKEDGTAQVPITSWMLALEGVVSCDVSLTDDAERKLTTETFSIHVLPAMYHGEDVEEEVQNNIVEELTDRLFEADQKVQEAASSAKEAAETVDFLILRGKNLIDPAAMTYGYDISPQYGVMVERSDKKCTDYIPIEPEREYTYSDQSGIYGYIQYGFYNERRVWIGQDAAKQTIRTPSEAKYLRLGVVASREHMQLEEGSVPTAYEAYIGTKIKHQYVDAYRKQEADALMSEMEREMRFKQNIPCPFADGYTEALLGISEIHLDGLETGTEVYLQHFRNNVFRNGLYETGFAIGMADGTVLAEYIVTGASISERNEKEMIRLKAKNSSVSGYALVDFQAFEDGFADENMRKLHYDHVRNLAMTPHIDHELLSLGSYDDIIRLNKDTESFLFHAGKTKPEDSYLPLRFIHCTDLHGQKKEWKRLVKYMDYYTEYLDFALHTGDLCRNSLASDGNLFGAARPKQLPVFQAVGEHDTYADEMMIAGSASQAAVKSVVFANMTNWGEVHFGSEASAMYYYRDFTEQGIRLIVLNDQNFTQTQAAWLTAVLRDAGAKKLCVITASHQESAKITQPVHCALSCETSRSSEISVPTQAFEAQIVSFQAEGGQHIVHLCGHSHTDHIGYTEAGILNMKAECAAHDMAEESVRIEGTKSFDSFHVICIDRNRHCLKEICIGNNTNADMMEKDAFCYDYLEKRMIGGELQVDTSLSEKGMAADAKAVGDRMEILKNMMVSPYLVNTAVGKSIALRDSVEREPIALEIMGQNSQNNWIGKNLLNANAVSAVHYITSTGTDSKYGVIVSGAGTYTISAQYTIDAYIYCVKLDAQSAMIDKPLYILVPSQKYTQTITLESGQKLFVYNATSTATVDLVKENMKNARIQIELGASATAYEPYCGGIPSPSLDYPQEIQYVKAGTKLCVSGKNLLDINSLSSVSYAIAGTVKENIGFLLEVPGTYTIHSEKPADRIGYIYARILDADHVSQSDIMYIVADKTSATKAVTVGEGQKLFLYHAQAGTVEQVKALFSEFKMQIEAGAVQTPYEPYHSGGELITPCDLYEGDVWYPLIGEVHQYHALIEQYNGETIEGSYTSTTGTLSKGAKVAYTVSEPMIVNTDPQTVSLTKEKAHMIQDPIDIPALIKMAYVADIKLYIDLKFQELGEAGSL